jgi:hypothetical protein
VAALEARDYAALENPSLLRFLVDMRGADVTQAQLVLLRPAPARRSRRRPGPFRFYAFLVDPHASWGFEPAGPAAGGAALGSGAQGSDAGAAGAAGAAGLQRDDLMTMMIAGHETTAAMLTCAPLPWSGRLGLRTMAERRHKHAQVGHVLPAGEPGGDAPGAGGAGPRAGGSPPVPAPKFPPDAPGTRAAADACPPLPPPFPYASPYRTSAHPTLAGGGAGRAPGYGDLMALEHTRLALAEALRLYPQPPIMIRRCDSRSPPARRRCGY